MLKYYLGYGGRIYDRKEKMLAGQIYDANYDKNLVEERQKAKELCFKYNMLNPSEQ